MVVARASGESDGKLLSTGVKFQLREKNKSQISAIEGYAYNTVHLKL